MSSICFISAAAGGHSVPGVDSADNVKSADVIGNKSDTHDGTSLMAAANKADDHVHQPQFVYPALAAAVGIPTGAGLWELGNFVEVVPVNTITDDFDMHFLFATMDANGLYIVNLYDGAGVLIGQAAPSRDDKKSTDVQIEIQTPILPGNTQIKAKAASESGNDSVAVKLYYHTY